MNGIKQKFYIACFGGLMFYTSTAQQPDEHIRLNQPGFYPSAPKIAVVINDSADSNFYVINTNKHDTAYKGKLSAVHHSNNSSVSTRIADISGLHKPGNYIVVAGSKESYPFSIQKNVLHEVAVASLKSYYYQRMSMPLEEKYAGKWARAEGHPDTVVYVHSSAATAQRPEGTIIRSPGGWYDAGDYNKYVVNSGITVATLLSAYEDFSNYFDALKTNIPESNDHIPDILNEALYNIRWMLTMQDPDDGGVYHKCTNANFDKMIMPDQATEKRYVVQKSTAATLDFAAVCAQASRIFSKYKKQFPGLSDSCLSAAVKAWQWAEKNPKVLYRQNEMNKQFQPAITTGAYGDFSVTDEWFWSACELYSTTGEEAYWQAIDTTNQHKLSLPTWNNVYTLGIYTLLRAHTEKHLTDVEGMKNLVIAFADDYAAGIQTSAFATVMGSDKKDFNWGSNSNAANQGIVLINAYLITQNKNYLDAALTNVDYILGRNATGYCFVTGIGTKSPMHPHHRPSIADGIEEPVPGLLAGGPNPGRQDGCKYQFTEPETAYTDDDCSYASNEIAINWNAPLVYILNAMEALQNKLK
ncbi:MAG TPA: glycoside hydrolase family 9 protein [Parafilimonas sp.]|nr:glycoside hydrolase family 9 protein [Parafilimonas sp.]